MRRLIVVILIFSLIPTNIQADINKIDEIAIVQGSITKDILGGNTTIIPIHNFEYKPGWLIYLEYTLTTNASSYFTDITYANTMKYRTQMGSLINALARVELTNNSFHNTLDSLTLLGDNKIPVYLSAEIFSDSWQGSKISIDYKIVILDRNDDIILDETKEYSGEIRYYPDSLNFKSSYIGKHNDDIYILMPIFIAQNESRLPDNYHYIMDIIIQFSVELFDTEATDLTFSIPPFAEEAKIEILEDGFYEVVLDNMENRDIQNLNIYHDGSDMKLIIQSIHIEVPALIDIPDELITPISIKISASIVAICFTLLPFKIVDSFGKKKINAKIEELL